MRITCLIVSLLVVDSLAAFIKESDFGTAGRRHVQFNQEGGDPDPRTEGENEPSYWQNNALNLLRQKLSQVQNNNIAKNVILFLGDGMSVPTITASRIYVGNMNGRPGEETQLSFESFPHTGLSKTYCVNSQVADSACSATAYLTGIKGNIETIGVTSDVKLNDCTAMLNQSFHTHSIVEWAQEAGKATGVITTTPVTDASPSGNYAHTANRHWQSDSAVASDVTDSPERCYDIAKQLVMGYPGKNIKVIMGGGLEMFTPKEVNDSHGTVGQRSDKLDLVQVWKDNKTSRNATSQFVYNRTELMNLDINNTDYLLGLFSSSYLNYHLDADATVQPTLEEMTSTAIRMLQKEENGYFLFVEGGLIDMGHHINKAHKALDEASEFDKAIKVALKLTSEEDTLIVVTADHSHTMAINGYARRGTNILTTLQIADDGFPYSTITYANGPHVEGKHETNQRHNLSLDTNREDKDYTYPTIFKMDWETHGGDDVAVYARGPSSHLLTGNYEQSYIPHVMAYAARIGPGNIKDTQKLASSAVTFKCQSMLLFSVILFLILNAKLNCI